jgi:cell division protein FtsA
MKGDGLRHEGGAQSVSGRGLAVQEHIVTGIDIGTQHTKVVVARFSSESHMHILGACDVPTIGMKRGGITDMDEVANTVATAIERCAHITGQQAGEVYLAITGEHIASSNHPGAIAITPADRDITMADVRRVWDVAGAVQLDPNRVIMAVLPRMYKVDGQEGIKNPIGMTGYRLEVEAHIVTGSYTAYRNLLKCAERQHITIEDVVVAPLASAEAVLAPSEREMGVMMIDMGSGTSDIAIFADGGVWRTFMKPLGGGLITDDIAYGLRLPPKVAEDLKVAYGSALPARIPPGEMIDLGQFLPDCREVVARRTLADIIAPRVEEMFALIRDDVRRAGRDHLFGGGVVLTGGAAELPGMAEVAMQIFEAPVRIGAPHSLYGATDAIVRPSFATAVGLLRWHEQALSSGLVDHTTRGLGRWLGWLRRFFGQAA